MRLHLLEEGVGSMCLVSPSAFSCSDFALCSFTVINHDDHEYNKNRFLLLTVVLFYTVPINMEFANMELLYVYILWRYRSYLQT